MNKPLDIVFVGLSISSSWGNGHATTYRSLVRGLSELGHRVSFLERDVPWYAANRDLPSPGFCALHLYPDIDGLLQHRQRLERADVVVVGSYVPQGREVIDLLAGFDIDRLCFYDIDTPVTLAHLKNGDEEFLARRQVPIFDIYFSFSGGGALEELEGDFGARRARALFCSVDVEQHRPMAEPIVYDLGYLGTYSSDRQPTVERLLLEPARRCPDRRFVVAGSQYPDTIEWPANVERIEHLPPSEHAAFYCRQRFTLNVTRADMIALGTSPSVRLFEAGACGTPVISDRWHGLDDIFPIGRAILACDSAEDVVRVLTQVSDGERLRIADAARRIVDERHTGLARAREFIRDIGTETAAYDASGRHVESQQPGRRQA